MGDKGKTLKRIVQSPQQETKKWNIALALLMTALSVAVMVLNNTLSIATTMLPFLATLFLVPIVVQLGYWYAIGVWLFVCAVSAWLVSDPIALGLYIAFGYYPVLRRCLAKLPTRYQRFSMKFCYFNVVFIGLFALLLFGFQVQEVAVLLIGATPVSIFILLLLYNITFFLFDFIVRQTEKLCTKTEKRLPKWAQKKRPMGKKERKQLRKAKKAQEAAPKKYQ